MIGVIIVLLIVAYVAYKFLGNNDNDYVKQRIKGRNENQKKVIRYFCNDDGCFSKRMKDEEYDAMVRNVLGVWKESICTLRQRQYLPQLSLSGFLVILQCQSGIFIPVHIQYG